MNSNSGFVTDLLPGLTNCQFAHLGEGVPLEFLNFEF
jgi:hypothetical protein